MCLSFFATIMLTDEKKLNYTIVKRKFNDGSPTVRHAAIKVEGIENYVFDLEIGAFVKLGKRSDSTIYYEKKAYFVNTPDAVILRDKDGRTVKYTEEDFFRVYAFRVVNSALN